MAITTSEALNLTGKFRFTQPSGWNGYRVFQQDTEIGTVWRNIRGQWRVAQMNGKTLPGFYRSRKVAAHWLAVTPVVGDAFDGITS